MTNKGTATNQVLNKVVTKGTNLVAHMEGILEENPEHPDKETMLRTIAALKQTVSECKNNI